jgi:hypothetical protein
MRDEPVYRGILGVDIERFSRAEWTDPIRARLRDRLHTLVDDALARAEIDPALTVRSDTGDGLWLLADAQVPTTRLLHPLATRLASGLAADNRRMPAGEGMRLRVVVHAGELLHDSYGHTGASLNHAARLLDADATRAVLAACPAAEVVLVVSDVLYDGVVRHAYQGIDPDGWQPVRVHGKETSARAWVHLPGLAAQPPLPAVLAASRVGPAGLPIPRELPRPPGDFTGRVGELASLRKLLRAGGSIAPWLRYDLPGRPAAAVRDAVGRWWSQRSTGWAASASPRWRCSSPTSSPTPAPSLTGSCTSTSRAPPQDWLRWSRWTRSAGCCARLAWTPLRSPPAWSRPPPGSVPWPPSGGC